MKTEPHEHTLLEIHIVTEYAKVCWQIISCGVRMKAEWQQKHMCRFANICAQFAINKKYSCVTCIDAFIVFCVLSVCNILCGVCIISIQLITVQTISSSTRIYVLNDDSQIYSSNFDKIAAHLEEY